MSYKLEHEIFTYDGDYYRFADYFLYDSIQVVDLIDSWVEKLVGDNWLKLNAKDSQDIIDLWWKENESTK